MSCVAECVESVKGRCARVSGVFKGNRYTGDGLGDRADRRIRIGVRGIGAEGLEAMIE